MSTATYAAQKILEKINFLISLSESANENEARNAALQAVKLIRKYKFPISQPHVSGLVYSLVQVGDSQEIRLTQVGWVVVSTDDVDQVIKSGEELFQSMFGRPQPGKRKKRVT